jgi:hypothetical protein
VNSSIKTASIVALSTFKQGLRGRLLFFILSAVTFIFVLGTGFSKFATKANLELRLVLETGMAFSALVVLGTAVLIACQGLGRNDDRGCYRLMFAMPLNKDGVYFGYLSGLWMTVFTYSAVMAVALSTVVYWRFGIFRVAIPLHFLTLFIEGAVLSSLAFLFSLSGSTVVSFFLAIAFGIIAHAEGVVLHLATESTHKLVSFIVPYLVRFLPALRSMSVKSEAVRDLAVNYHNLGWGIAYNLIYIAAVVVGLFLVRRAMEHEGR